MSICLDRFDANHVVAARARGKSSICIICRWQRIGHRCAFLIQLPNGDSVNMDVVYPLQTLKPIATQLRSRMQSDTNDDVSWRERIEHAILNIPFTNVTAFLGQPVMSMGQLIRLQTGDVVPIQVNDGIELRVEDNPIFLADIGEVSGQAAVNLSLNEFNRGDHNSHPAAKWLKCIRN